MAYFSNGTEGEMWEGVNCHGCVHEDGCAILCVHCLYNYDQHDKTPRGTALKEVLDILLPTGDDGWPAPCPMRVPQQEGESDGS